MKLYGKILNNNDIVTKKYVDDRNPPFKDDIDGHGKYIIHPDGTFEAWLQTTGNALTITTPDGGLYTASQDSFIHLPSEITEDNDVGVIYAHINVSHSGYSCFTTVNGATEQYGRVAISYSVHTTSSRNYDSGYTITAYIFGTVA